MRVAIQGEVGSFHHVAAQRQYGADIQIVPCEEFADVFSALATGQADTAVVAIENSLYGSINEVYDLLLKHNFSIVAELPERIHQCLIGFAGTNIDDITHVYSHPVALAQCSNFLHTSMPASEKTEFFDTAAAVRHVKELGDARTAAIGSKLAAELHGLTVLQPNIENHELNYTRFLAIERAPAHTSHSNKASFVLQTSNKPGSLYAALGVFAEKSINIVKLQSRPIPGQVWRYMFYIDAEATSPQVANVITELESQDCTVRLLGEYHSQTTEDI
jgi:prephenate dehydratase